MEFGDNVWVRVLTRVKIGTRDTRQLNPEDYLLLTEEKLDFKDGDKVGSEHHAIVGIVDSNNRRQYLPQHYKVKKFI